ncbi:alpha/beta fold hydrolase [Frankia sp. AgKG'84/4]|uniref:alpha/beta fold hydrolase n=1 Tax=Frankia sp. AgKG'84/4 TaxID=573490 RepID=UPI00200C6A34|nr:alpha/beta fold hydrolase [Frankia sp. AgKG'84/4]MCL9795279.1 alpha/beta hydrolase [Frankia sp. AgKG'84/4]
MTEVIANDVRLHVQRLTPKGGAATDAPVVVMVHGMVMDNMSSFYFALGTWLADAGCDVICYDLRGHGRSERTAAGYQLADSLADLTGLLDVLGVDRPVHVVGNSYGATMALAYGLESSDRVASLTLIEPPFLIEGLGEEMARSLSEILVAMSDEEVAGWIEDGAGRVAGRALRSARRLIGETTIATDMLATPPFSRDALAALPVPVLAVYGENSDIIGQAEGLAALVPDCTLVILAHHTHMVLREATAFLRVLLGWWLLDRDAPQPEFHPPTERRFETPEWVTQMVPPPNLARPEIAQKLST